MKQIRKPVIQFKYNSLRSFTLHACEHLSRRVRIHACEVTCVWTMCPKLGGSPSGWKQNKTRLSVNAFERCAFDLAKYSPTFRLLLYRQKETHESEQKRLAWLPRMKIKHIGIGAPHSCSAKKLSMTRFKLRTNHGNRIIKRNLFFFYAL
jgi:hypothetical protein